VYGDYYGTLRPATDAVLAQGLSMLFDVDVKGGLSIKRCYPDALLIFIRPPSPETLIERLRGRQTEDEQTIRKRMQRVAMELELGRRFDHEVVNDDLPAAVAKVDRLVQRHLELP
jgi:guanylate kinase